MDTNEHELILKEEVFAVVGSAMEVLNVLGHGLIEKPYENALVVEFGLRGIAVRQQPCYEVDYKGRSDLELQTGEIGMETCRAIIRNR